MCFCSAAIALAAFLAGRYIYPHVPDSNVPVTERISRQNTNRPVERPFEQPQERPFGQPLERPLERPYEQPLERPLERPVEQSLKQPLEQPFEYGDTIKEPEPSAKEIMSGMRSVVYFVNWVLFSPVILSLH